MGTTSGPNDAMDATTAAERIERGEVFLLDVREDDEWAAGHIPAATHIPMGEVAARSGELPADREILTVCRSGKRSGEVAEQLNEQGYRARNLDGGMIAWQEIGGQVQSPGGSGGA